jgi:hypothetical protein
MRVFRKKVAFFVSLFLMVLPLLLFAQDAKIGEIPLDPGPGIYSEDVVVSLHNGGEHRYQYRFVGSGSRNWIDYLIPLQLTAAPGEERLFQIQIRELPSGQGENGLSPFVQLDDSMDYGEYSYIIDRAAPPMPRIVLEGGNGKYEAVLTFGEQAGGAVGLEARNGNRIYYWISDFARDEYRPYTGGTLPLRGGSVLKTFTVDEAGNYSKILTKKIAAFPPCGEADAIELPSPVEGTFINPQRLVVANPECFEWVRYTVDGTDPVYRGAVYTEPLLIRMQGQVLLKVAAKKYHSDEVLSRTVRFFIEENPIPDFSMTGGESLNSLESFPFPGKREGYRFFYTLEERSLTPRDRALTQEVEAGTTEGTMNYLVYRVGAYDTETGRMYQLRSFYTVDRRKPAPPIVELSEELPFSKSLSVTLRSSEGADIFYTTDGTTPDLYSNRYTGPVTLRPSSGLDIGVLTLQAIARYGNGKTSDVITELLPFDRRVPDPPTYTISEISSGGALFNLSHSEKDVRFLYRLVYSETAGISLDKNSPECGEQLRLTFPHGYQGKARLRFAVVDKAGNISQPTSIEEVQVDTVPPPTPEITFSDTLVEIKGEGSIYFRIGPGNTGYKRYTGSFRLDAPDGKKTEYRIRAYSEDEKANRSTYSEEKISYDRRRAELPEVKGIRDGMFYSEPVEIGISEEYSDLVTYYRLTNINRKGVENDAGGEDQNVSRPGQDKIDSDGLAEGTSPVDFSDSVFSGSLRVEGEAEREVRYRLEMRSYLPGSDSWSETARFDFTIDRRAPEEIDLTPFISPGLFKDTTLIIGKNPSPDELVWVYAAEDPISRDQEKTPEKIRENGKSLAAGIELRGEKGEEKLYYLYAAVFDPAGNAAVSGPFEATVDMLKPEIPLLTGGPMNRISGDSLTIARPEDYPHEIVYELSSDLSMPPEPDASSQRLIDPLVLNRDDKKVNIYTLIYRGLDRAGNLSEPVFKRFFFDATKPAAPEIHIEVLGRGRCEIFIKSLEASTLMYSLNGEAFKEFELPFLYTTDESTRILNVKAYAMNASGRISPIIEKKINFPVLVRPLVQGVTDGRTYNKDLKITPSREEHDIRYVLRENRGAPLRIGPESPRLGDGIEIKVREGSEKGFVLITGILDPLTSQIEAAERFEFVIDKAAPTPPQLTGVEANAHYTDDRTITLESRSEKTVLYFRLGENREADTPFRRYTQPEKVSVRPGVRKNFYLEYKAEDTAGNSSETVKTYFVIDKAGIYVSTLGDDRQNGGKETPFRTLDRAVFEARQTKRNTIYLGNGEFQISDGIKVNTSLTLRGGYEEGVWERGDKEKSLITVSPGLEPADSMFEIVDGTLNLEGVFISNLGLSGPVISQRGEHSNLIVRGCRFIHADGSQPSFVHTEKGNLLFADTLIEAGPAVSGKILNLSEADIVLRDCKISAGDGSRNMVLLYVQKGRLELLSSDLEIGKADTSVNLFSVDAEIRIEDSFFRTGAGTVKSTGIYQRGGTLVIKDSVIGFPPDGTAQTDGNIARIAMGIEIESSRAEISGSLLNSRGTNGIVQVNSSSSNVVVSGSSLQNAGTREFSYLMRSSGGSLSISDSRLETGPADEITALDARDRAVLMLRDSTVKTGRGGRSVVGIKAGGKVTGTIQENIFIADPEGAESTGVEVLPLSGAAPAAVPEIGLKLIGNEFQNWSYLLATGKERVSRVDQLEMERPPFDRKNPHHGNSQR